MGPIWGVTVGIGNGVMAVLAAARGERTGIAQIISGFAPLVAWRQSAPMATAVKEEQEVDAPPP